VDDTCGMFVTVNDAHGLAAALRTLMDDRSLRARLGAAGPARSRELCDPASQIDQIRQTFDEVVHYGRPEIHSTVLSHLAS
jgi:glycosyltransferase involved in cell wall biosynthesis